MEDFAINVTIANRKYRLSIERDNEEFVRKAVKIIDDKLKEYSNVYSYKDYQDLLAMVALEYTTLAINYEGVIEKNHKKLEEKLVAIDSVLAENDSSVL
jgi:cell division protein ZapA